MLEVPGGSGPGQWSCSMVTFYTSMAGVIISRESLVTATGYLLEKVSELMPDYH